MKGFTPRETVKFQKKTPHSGDAALISIHPRKLTCPLKINGWKMYFQLNWSLFRGHVSFREGRFNLFLQILDDKETLLKQDRRCQN